MQKIKYLILLFIPLILLTGCGVDLTNGTIEGYKYEEVDEVTNYVKIVTDRNKIILIELYPEVAPLTVENFQKLVSEKFYDGIIFHRVIKNFMIQGGDPTGTGYHGSGENIIGEFSNNGIENNLKHEEGIVSMARGEEMNTASSQFFICVNSNEYIGYLDGDYAAFGKVIAGYDNVVEISKVATNPLNDKPTTDQTMKTVRFVKVDKK